MPEVSIEVNVIRSVRRDSAYEYWIDIIEDGELIAGNLQVKFDVPKTDEEITMAVLNNIYIPIFYGEE
jgi:hypothetical protein